jgi:hypothetical protein
VNLGSTSLLIVKASWLKNNPQVEAEMLPLLQQRVTAVLA